MMASINKTGFFVNPDLNTAIDAIERPGMNFIGMSTLSGEQSNQKKPIIF